MPNLYEQLIAALDPEAAFATPSPPTGEDQWKIRLNKPNQYAALPPQYSSPAGPAPLPKGEPKAAVTGIGDSGKIKTPGGLLAEPDGSYYSELIKGFQAKSGDMLKQQAEGIEGQEAMLRAALEHKKPQVDYSAMMGLADAFTGSRMAQTYHRPEDPNDDIAKLQAALQKGRNDLGENEVALLKSALGAEGELMASRERAKDRALARDVAAGNKDDARNDRLSKEDQNQRESLENKMGQKFRDATRFQQNLADFIDLTKNGIPKSGKDRQRAESLYADLTVAYKNPAGLGALAGPDVNIIKGVLGPNSYGDFISSYMVKGGDQGVREALKDVAVRNKRVFDDLHRAGKLTYPNKATNDILSEYRNTFDNTYGSKTSNAPVTAANVTPEQAAAELAKRGKK